MIKKNILWVILVISILALSLIGCGKSKEGQEAKETGEVKKIKILTTQPQFQATYEKYAKKYEDEYNAKGKEKIKIEIESYPSAQYATLIKSKLASGDAIDLFQIHAGNELGMYVKTGYLEDLTDTGIKDKLLPSTAEALSMDGKFYGLPLETLVWGILYNKDMFDKLGLKPAETLDELKANAEKIKAAGNTPFLLSYKEQWIPQLFLPLTVGGAMKKVQPNFVDDMNNNNSSFKAISSQIFDVMDFVNANGNKKALEIDGTNGCAEFASGKYGMWVQGPWFADTILAANKDIKFGVSPLPIDNDKENTVINQSASTAFVISKNSKNKEIAKDFLGYLLRDDVTNDFYTELKFNQVAKNQTFEMYPWVKEAMEYVKAGKTVIDPKIPQAVKDESGKAFQSYSSKGMTKEQAIESLDNAWKVYNKNQ